MKSGQITHPESFRKVGMGMKNGPVIRNLAALQNIPLESSRRFRQRLSGHPPWTNSLWLHTGPVTASTYKRCALSSEYSGAVHPFARRSGVLQPDSERRRHAHFQRCRTSLPACGFVCGRDTVVSGDRGFLVPRSFHQYGLGRHSSPFFGLSWLTGTLPPSVKNLSSPAPRNPSNGPS